MQDTQSQEQKTVTRIYGALFAALVFSLVPSLAFAVIALIFFMAILIVAYIVRSRAKEDSLAHNHMVYLIRTLWISLGLIPGITMILASFYLLPNYTPQPLAPCADNLANELINNPEQNDVVYLYNFIEPCMDAFMTENKVVFIVSGLIAGAPVIIYLLLRLFRGLSRAKNGYRIANPKSWM